jgi:hypothetical protein
MPLPWWDVEDLLDDVDLEPNDRTYKLGNLCQRNLRAIRPSNCARLVIHGNPHPFTFHDKYLSDRQRTMLSLALSMTEPKEKEPE